MRKRTVITSHIDYANHTAYVKNFGIEELRIFKKLTDNGIELKDDNISDEELCVMLRYLCTDGIIESVWSINNNFNRDQKEINIIKHNVEEKLKAKGLEIITHCDWTPSFSLDYNVVNDRNYLTLLTENIREKELVFANIEKEINDIYEKIRENRDVIRKQNWYIDKTKECEKEYNIMLEKFNKIVERYKNGKKICDQQLIEAKEQWPEEIKNLENEIKSKKEMILSLNDEINKIMIDKKEKLSEFYKIEKKYNYVKNRLDSYENELDKILEKYK